MDRMVPPNEGLRADELTGTEVNDRLVVQHELSLVDGSTQLRFELEPGLGRFLHRRLEDDDSIAAAVPGDRSRHFCPSQQAARIGLGRRGCGGAHARGQMDRVVGEVDRLAEGGEDAIGRSKRIVRRRVTVE